MVRAFAAVVLLCVLPVGAPACSVLSHEALVDALWDVRLQPMLKAKYPDATADDLKRAHAFAYGGSIIQDLGYYPHGSHEFSDLTHYVRSGDFINTLLGDAKSLDESAFALGAMSHYVADVNVHREATNPGEAMLYPSLRLKFGPTVTYEDDPAAHLKTEFGFDVLEVAKGRFAPEAYHDFIGFNVADDLLHRAFRETYGLDLNQLFGNYDRAIGSYRRAVSRTIPQATRVAWAQRGKDIEASQPGATQRSFVYVMSRSSYERDWGRQYDRPSFVDRLLAVLLKIIPPVGPLRALQFKMPTPEVEALFMKSFADATQRYKADLDPSGQPVVRLENINFDLGALAGPGKYRLQDDTVAIWVDQLAKTNFADITAPVRATILGYYRDPNAPIATRRDYKKWQRLQAELQMLGRAGS